MGLPEYSQADSAEQKLLVNQICQIHQILNLFLDLCLIHKEKKGIVSETEFHFYVKNLYLQLLWIYMV